MEEKDLLIDYTAVMALDKLIKEGDIAEALKFLKEASVKHKTAVSIYLCKMSYRLALMRLDAETRTDALEDIISLSILNERVIEDEI